MSVQENKALARRVFDEIWSGGKLDLVDELLDPEFVGRPIGLAEPFKGPEGAKEFIGRLREAFPDIRFPIDDLIGEEDKVVVRWTATGTNDGEFMGIEPSGRQVTIAGMTIRAIRDGRIIEGWTNMDALGLLRQIGAVPEPARR